ncbi:glycosyltransferase family 4 protein [Neoroseomonas oryzicola]|uniref:Glycosyltransferase family 4 protein n=1 Tax=Neoroseomonas oryzicola TaxID=535904 RepID=A0A9X9WFL1_9PROT|nr:glycosyltransferase family 4 protein [Neoroseomonas oryzicola]MBR0659121.1 glycosyltransferase family 4 protein [Neoroseomonas oryzicola]NKE17693.1 glycosyltransferase family 4 protein [Neoroseomonas oryzicola]
MRILVVSNLFPPVVIGGYELGCAKAAAGLRGRGHDVRVLTTWSHLPRHAEALPGEVRRLDLPWLIPERPADRGAQAWLDYAAMCSSLPNTMALLDELRAFRPDVVYAWNLVGIGGAALVDLLDISGLPWVWHLMDRAPADIMASVTDGIGGLFGQGLRALRRGKVIAMSRHLVDEIEYVADDAFPIPVEIIPGWADAADTLPHLPYLRGGVARFVTAGAMHAHKGIDLILEASRMLKSEGLRFEVDLFGAGEVSHYIGLAQSLQVQDVVRFHGPRTQQELMRLYRSYDAFLFPTHEREPFGFAPIEAAAAATPPIMTANCGAAERLVGGVHCLKIPRSAEALAGAMRQVAARAVDIARVGRAARRLVEEDLSFRRCLDRIEAVLRETSSKPSVRRVDDPSLTALAFLKHNLSVRLRFG